LRQPRILSRWHQFVNIASPTSLLAPTNTNGPRGPVSGTASPSRRSKRRTGIVAGATAGFKVSKPRPHRPELFARPATDRTEPCATWRLRFSSGSLAAPASG
jgi:hypothetical protein